MEKLAKITWNEFQQKVQDGSYVLYFEATWCGDCRFIKPFMPAIEQDFPEYKFLKIDRDENIDLCEKLDVMGIPSFIVYRDGKEIDRFVNKDRKTKEQIETFLKNAQ